MSASRFCAALLLFTSLGGGAFAADAPPSPQVLYNQAQAAFDKGDWDNAIDGFNKALAAMNAGPTSRSRAMINVRLAQALLHRSRFAEAQQIANSAIGVLSDGKPDSADELTSAYIALAEAQRFDLQFREAADSYRHALALASPKGGPDDIDAQIGLVLATMVVDPDTAAATAGELLNNQTLVASLPKARLAEFESLKGRAELNRGHADMAEPFVSRAVNDSGGLTENVSLAQVSIRGDAALVRLKLGRTDKARELLAYTGAGHLKDEHWIARARTDLPQCGGPLDITPQDTAVIEFGINADGRVSGVAPIYASRPGDMGVAFAKAVRRWRWDPQDVAALNPFWRASIRLQLRCDVRPSGMADSFLIATTRWLSALGANEVDLGAPEPSTTQPFIQGAVDKEADEISAALHALKYGHLDPAKHAQVSAQLALLLAKHHAPPEVMATYFLLDSDDAKPGFGSRARDRARRLAADISTLPTGGQGARAAAWLKTEMAIGLEREGDFTEALPSLTNVANMPEDQLASDDDIRQVATIHLAVVRARLDKSAKISLAAGSAPPDRCSTLDVRPVATNMSISDSTFPAEAMRWGFEGYVREAFDIGRDGSVKGVRTVIAYPPFVFDEATEGAVGHFRYLPPIDSDGAFVGCTNQTISVNYHIDR